jgi:hypothetical protein
MVPCNARHMGAGHKAMHEAVAAVEQLLAALREAGAKPVLDLRVSAGREVQVSWANRATATRNPPGRGLSVDAADPERLS